MSSLAAGPCSPPCHWTNAQGVEFVELPRQVSGSASVDDTWLLVLISCSVGVLLLGSLLALLLLKCREDRGGKAPIEGDSKQRCEAVLYPSGGGEPAALWATLTPRGTTTHQLLCNHAQGHNHHNSGRLFENSAFIEPEECCLRPRHQQLLVSSPTRIENPNLPPLNLHRSLRRPPADHTPAL
ncbi:hypothetical protein AAG570_009018 [Ranatra chinensis]|uniref:Uncharacterized protein n=1 Tax=Ranatra chinensis TaxID=642074 RepID=A0ABD0YSQ0_9HEMI